MAARSAGMGKTKSARANLVLPVARVQTIIRKLLPSQRLQSATPIVTAAILEYLAKEIISAAGNVVRKDGRKRITPMHLWKGIREDDDLNVLCGNIQGSSGNHFAASTTTVATTAATTAVVTKKRSDEPTGEQAEEGAEAGRARGDKAEGDDGEEVGG